MGTSSPQMRIGRGEHVYSKGFGYRVCTSGTCFKFLYWLLSIFFKILISEYHVSTNDRIANASSCNMYCVHETIHVQYIELVLRSAFVYSCLVWPIDINYYGIHNNI